MSNLVLKIENGMFVSSNHSKGKEIATKQIEEMGWKAIITDNGKIFCEAKKEYSDGLHSMRYTVNQMGLAKLTLKRGREKLITLRRCYVSPKNEGIKNGTLTLSGGKIEDRFAYFRCESFNNLLEKYRLKGIKHQDPNKEYKLKTYTISSDEKEKNNVFIDDIITDGSIEEIQTKNVSIADKYNKHSCISAVKTVRVNNASWVILNSNGSRFLYTLEYNINKLKLS